jgi:hypothetical protein
LACVVLITLAAGNNFCHKKGVLTYRGLSVSTPVFYDHLWFVLIFLTLWFYPCFFKRRKILPLVC